MRATHRLTSPLFTAFRRSPFTRRSRSERGAILIVTAITIVTLMALSAFAIDAGLIWLARAQAQTAADAAALAGATGLQYDLTKNLTPTGAAYRGAAAFATQNRVFGGSQGVHVDVAADLTTWEHSAPASCSAGGCVQVDIYQDSTHGSPGIPSYFANIFSVARLDTKATATAQIMTANTSNCLAPYFLLDRYIDNNGSGTYTNPPDTYVPAGQPSPTGYTLADIGTTVTFHDNLSPSGYGQLDVGSGTSAIRDALNSCWTSPVSLAPPVGMLDTDPGNKAGQKNGLDDLIASDPLAMWDPTTRTVINSCANTNSCSCPAAPGGICKYGGAISPRILQVMICAPTELACAQGGGGSTKAITPVNILSFFLDHFTFVGGNLTLYAVIVGSPGTGSTAGVPGGAGFLTTVGLIR